MSILELTFQDGQWDALARFKLAAPRMHPTVQGSTLLSGRGTSPNLTSDAMQQLKPSTSPDTVKQVFDIQEQGKVRLEPARKMAADALCTTCRRPKHYGPCLKPSRTPPPGVPLKEGSYNYGLKGSDPEPAGAGSNMAHSAFYHSGVVGPSTRQLVDTAFDRFDRTTATQTNWPTFG